MESSLPKVLVPVLGRPMIDYVLDAIAEAGVERSIAVVGFEAEMVRQAIADRPGIAFALQEEQLGTGHAVMMCRDQLADHQGPVVLLTGDSPLTQPSSLKKLLTEFEASRPACLIGTAFTDRPHGLGRVCRDAAGKFLGIVEERDATDAEKEINEVNMSTYIFDCQTMLASLERLTTDNAQQEYYITDLPALLLASGEAVEAIPALQPCEALSINNLEELAAAEQELIRLGVHA